MPNNQYYLVTFFTFLILSVFVFFLSSKSLLFGSGVIGNGLFAVEGLVYSLSHPSLFSDNSSQIAKLRQENSDLKSQLTDLRNVVADNKALRDQFEIATVPSQNLLPSQIIGAPSFIPGVSLPEELIVEMGEKEGVQKGEAVLMKNTLVGFVTKTSLHASEVRLTSNPSTSFTAQTQETGALGIVKGMGNGQIVLDNVALSDQLKVGDSVVTSGTQDIQETGLPPGLLIGVITSIEKKPSSLFQKAYIKSPLEVEKLRMVFILGGSK